MTDEEKTLLRDLKKELAQEIVKQEDPDSIQLKSLIAEIDMLKKRVEFLETRMAGLHTDKGVDNDNQTTRNPNQVPRSIIRIRYSGD